MTLVWGPGLPNPNPISVQDTGWVAIDIPHVLYTYRKHVVFLDTWEVGDHVSLLQVGNVEFRVGMWLLGVSIVVGSCLPGQPSHAPSLLACHPGFHVGPHTPSSFSFRAFAYAVPSPWPSSLFIFTDALLFMFFIVVKYT